MDKDLRTTLTRHRKAERALHSRLVREIELLVTLDAIIEAYKRHQARLEA